MSHLNLLRKTGFTPLEITRLTKDLRPNVSLGLSLTGFTLLELMVVVLILTIILTAIFSFLTTGNRLWQTDSVLAQIQAQVRNGMEFMTKELYGAKIITPDIGLSADNITFQMPDSILSGEIVWSSNIQYSVNANKQLVRTQTGQNDKIIANDVSSVSFNYAESDKLIVNLTLQKNTILQEPTNTTLSAQVTLRN